MSKRFRIGPADGRATARKGQAMLAWRGFMALVNRPAPRRSLRQVRPGRGRRRLWLLEVLILGGLALLSMQATCAGVRVDDDAGNVVALKEPAARIISFAPHVTELLFTAGAGSRLVGATRYSDFPAEAQKLARVGDSSLIDMERILSLKPDLIIVWLGNSERQLGQLRSLGIPVFSSDPRRLEDISRTIRRFGALAGTGRVADEAAASFDNQVAALRRRYSGRVSVTIFYQISSRPLLTINRQHLIDDAIRLCGGRNIFAGLAARVPNVSVEAVVDANPEAIATAGGEPGLDNGLGIWKKLPGLTATSRDNFIVLDSDTMSRPTTRIVQGIRALCEGLEAVRAKRRP